MGLLGGLAKMWTSGLNFENGFWVNIGLSCQFYMHANR
jgi:hypothetical protein